MAEELRVGILGAGAAGGLHAQAYGRLEKVKIAGLWSRTRSRAEGLVEKLGLSDAGVYDCWEDMIEGDEVDVVSIATPAALRVEPVRMALERGIHVLVEKPFATSLDQAHELVGLAKNASSVTALCFNWRYSPGNQVARSLIQTGALGQVRSLRIVWRLRWVADIEAFKSHLNRRPWERSPDTGGGLLRHMATHELDRVRFLAGVDAARVVGKQGYVSIEDTRMPASCNLLVELSNGAFVEICVMTTTGQNERSAFYVGEEGSVFATHESVVRQLRDDAEPVEVEVPESDRVPQGLAPIQHTCNRLIEEFCVAARTGDIEHARAPCLPSFADGLHSQKLIAAAETSEAESRWVSMDELDTSR